MKTTIQHHLYGRIQYDMGTGRVTVQKDPDDLAGQIRNLIDPKNSSRLGSGYWPNRFLRACDLLAILKDAKSVKVENKIPLPEGAVE